MRNKRLIMLTGAVITSAMLVFAEGCSGVSEGQLRKVAQSINQTDFRNPQSTNALAKDMSSALNTEKTKFVEATLVRVVDGDTIVVKIDGQEARVRLIGINTPESVAPDSYKTKNTKEGVLASDYLKNLLKNTKTVYLEKDKSETDKYGRLLRYVWLEEPENRHNINEISTKMLNGILLLDNVAEPVKYKPDVEYADDFDYINEL